MPIPLPQYQTPLQIGEQSFADLQRLRQQQQQLRQQAIQNQFLPQQEQEKLDLLKAQVRQAPSRSDLLKQQAAEKAFYLKHPLLKTSGPGQQVGALKLAKEMQDQGAIPPGTYENLQKNIGSKQNLQNIRAKYYNELASGHNFQLLPKNDREQWLAEARGMGIDPSKAIEYYNKKYTMEDVAKEKGFNPNNMPDPIFPTDSNAVKQYQLRRQNLAELEALQPMVSKGLAPYSKSFMGMSPAQLKDIFKNEVLHNPTASLRQAHFLAARALQPELAALRLKSANANVNSATINEITSKTFDNLKNYQSAVDPQTYALAQKIMQNMISKVSNSANKVILNIGRFKKQVPQKNSIKNPQSASKAIDYKDYFKEYL